MEGKHMVWMILELMVLSISKWSIALDPLNQGAGFKPPKHVLQLLTLSVQGCGKWLIPNTACFLYYCVHSENITDGSEDCKNKLE